MGLNRYSLADIQEFFGRYRRLQEEWADFRFESFRASFDRIALQMEELREEDRRRERGTAPGHNLFFVLQMARDEARAHTPVLSYFLDPEAAHGQGYLFLKHFVNACKGKYENFPVPERDIGSALWHVDSERMTGFGRPDIMLGSVSLGYRLIIENKIDARDHQGQLDGYAKLIRKDQGRYAKQALVYLTVDGQTPSGASRSDSFQISYKLDLAEMFKAALSDVMAPNVKATVEQYLEVIRTL